MREQVKEKVEDMFAEREMEHGTEGKIDLSKAKFGVVTDGCGPLSPSELDAISLLPIYVIPESTGDPITVTQTLI